MGGLDSKDILKDKKITGKRGKLFWFFAFLLFGLIVTIVVILTQSINGQDVNLPSKISAIIYDGGRDRYKAQVQAIQNNMKWLTDIHVISTNTSIDEFQGLGNLDVFYHTNPLIMSQLDAYAHIANIEGVQDKFIFFSDMTFPFTTIKKTYLFSRSHPRVFNLPNNDNERRIFPDKVEELIACYVTDLEDVKTYLMYSNVIYAKLVTDVLFSYEGINKEVLLYGDLPDIIDDQFNLLERKSHYFITFHCSGDTDYANENLTLFLNSYFNIDD